MDVGRRGVVMRVLRAILGAPRAADAHPPAGTRRIGVFGSPDWPSDRYLWAAFRQMLREAGWVEGHNLVIEWRTCNANQNINDVAAKFVRLGVDVIVAPYSHFAQAAKEATSTIPIVMISDGDPIADGLVRSFARPGGNVTGVATHSRAVVTKQMALWKAVSAMLPPAVAALAVGLDYRTDLHEVFRRLAVYVDKILKGASPADLPIADLTKYELVVNMKTAKALGLTIPRSVLVLTRVWLAVLGVPLAAHAQTRAKPRPVGLVEIQARGIREFLRKPGYIEGSSVGILKLLIPARPRVHNVILWNCWREPAERVALDDVATVVSSLHRVTREDVDAEPLFVYVPGVASFEIVVRAASISVGYFRWHDLGWHERLRRDSAELAAKIQALIGPGTVTVEVTVEPPPLLSQIIE